MPTFNRENALVWKELSDVDYFTQFIKAWLAFNAWMRNAYGNQLKDRGIINALKENSNAVKNKILSLLEDNGPNGDNFRGLIAELHNELENNRLTTKFYGNEQRISFTQIKSKNPTNEDDFIRRTTQYKLKRQTTGQDKGKVSVKLINTRNQQDIFNYEQNEYNIEDLKAYPNFNRLSDEKRKTLLQIFESISPFKTISLLATSKDQETLTIGTIQFINNPEQIGSDLIEILYLLRCQLFHGEIVPKKQYNQIYEPAYRIVKILLDAI